ncbi:hypothetical protein CPB85DRAFT_1438061 [Mucidula mucida]|nr:hypothetical protein CPB85DRAFT_1438061 [Mucidula mucida]
MVVERTASLAVEWAPFFKTAGKVKLRIAFVKLCFLCEFFPSFVLSLKPDRRCNASLPDPIISSLAVANVAAVGYILVKWQASSARSHSLAVAHAQHLVVS